MTLGKTLMVVGLVLVVAGLLLHFSGKIPFIGRLPGDIRIEKENFSLYFPLGSCLLLSLILSVLFWFFKR